MAPLLFTLRSGPFCSSKRAPFEFLLTFIAERAPAMSASPTPPALCLYPEACGMRRSYDSGNELLAQLAEYSCGSPMALVKCCPEVSGAVFRTKTLL